MADIQISASIGNQIWMRWGRCGPYWTSPTVGYIIYSRVTDYHLVYQKTADGGATWGGEVGILGDTITALNCWADWETPGDLGTVIHMVFIDVTENSISYISFDTSDDSISAETPVEECRGTGTINGTIGSRDYSVITLTKSVGGKLAVGFKYRDNAPVEFNGFYVSGNNGATWDTKAALYEGNADYACLLPGNEGDTDDLYCLYLDRSASDTTLKVYDASGNSWSETNINTDTPFNTGNYLWGGGAVRYSDGHIIGAFWTEHDSPTADLEVWDINGAGSIIQKTDVKTDSGESCLSAVFIDQSTDDIYIVYITGIAWLLTTGIYYKKSVDGGDNWGPETKLSADVDDDLLWVSAGAVNPANGGRLMPIWENDDFKDVLTNKDNSIEIPAAAGGLENKSANMGSKMLAASLL